MPPTLFLLGGLIGVSALGLLFVLLGLGFSSTSAEARRLAQYVANPIEDQAARPDPLTYRRAELQGTFGQRLLLPWFRRLGDLLGFLAPNRSLASLRRQLTIAGNPLGLGPREFYGLQLIFIVLSFYLAYTLVAPVLAPHPVAPISGSGLPNSQSVPLLPANPQLNLYRFAGAILALLIGTRLPKTWLRGRVRARQKRIRRNLPDALDMLSVCADAGLGFDQALQRVSERWNTPLGKEFARLVEEMTMGLSRSEALRSLADRLNVDELSSFVAVMIQSDQMGVSITQTLRSQAEQMRVERRHRAQEEARKAPLKMLLPMICLILPAMGVVVVGPVIPAILDMFAALRGAR
jgi:tight adherence protein C